jgi:hypothetical protein
MTVAFSLLSHWFTLAGNREPLGANLGYIGMMNLPVLGLEMIPTLMTLGDGNFFHWRWQSFSLIIVAR